MRCSILVRRIELEDGSQVYSNIYVIVRLGGEFIINEFFIISIFSLIYYQFPTLLAYNILPSKHI